jgi:hypothetical protein
MTISYLFEVMGGVLLAGAIIHLFFGRGPLGVLLCAAGNLALGVSELLARAWIPASFSLAVAAWCGWNWWRRNRKRSPRALGAKAQARLAALVKTLRESLRPRPVLRPAPGGAS